MLDERDFERLYTAYFTPLVRFASQYVSRDLAADLVNDLFFSIWEHRTTWAPQTSERAYLYKAIRHRLANVARDMRRAASHLDAAVGDDEVLGMGSADERLDTIIEQSDRATHLWGVVDTLSPRSRMVLNLRWRSQLSFEEIAEVIGSTAVAVKRHHARALADLRDRIPEYLR